MSHPGKPKLPIINIDEFDHNANWSRYLARQRRERIIAETDVEHDDNHTDKDQPPHPTNEAQLTTPPPN